MLVEFTVGNYRSIFEPVTLSLVATKTVSRDKQIDHDSLLALQEDLSVLKSLVIYGANASGKSTVVSALHFMRSAILGTPALLERDRPIDPPVFRLRTDAIVRPSLFQIVFFIDEVRYQYGFQVRDGLIEQEWLYKTPTIREATLFEREGQQIRVGDLFKEGRGLEERTRPETLFLSTCAAFNVPEADVIVGWFRKLFVQQVTAQTKHPDDISRRAFMVEETHQDILRLITSLDLGILGLELEESGLDFDLVQDDDASSPALVLHRLPSQRIKTVHAVRTPEQTSGGVARFDLLRDESSGTQQLFNLAGPIVNALRAGSPIVIDEFDAHLHPLLTRTLIQLFNSARTNPLGAQLVFTTHDTNLLDRTLFRRDQVWFTEKDMDAATKLYSLIEFKVRNDASFETNYIRGRYGAIPYFGAFIWGDASDSAVEHTR